MFFRSAGRSEICLLLVTKLFSIMAVHSWFKVLVCRVPILGAKVGSAYNVSLDPFRYSLKLSMPQTAAEVSNRNGE